MKLKLIFYLIIFSFNFVIGQQTNLEINKSLQKMIFNNAKSFHSKNVEVLHFLSNSSNYTFAEDKFKMMLQLKKEDFLIEVNTHQYKSFQIQVCDSFLEEVIIKEFLNQHNIVLATAKANQKLKKIKSERNRFLKLIELTKNNSIQTGNNSIVEKSNYLTTLDEVLQKFSLNFIAINLN